ncbi:rhodanese-like/PpiC domain-containing protein 12, chloroplastic isoform X1 [Actinidia eriantha]|uniref:rhodanese-like/PpiC domain-containing protein 12, chloroplastic isoform X1 n=1 Tax=Actinidia eriantha TaxID=165200 RepID=UPI002584CDF7|nr:rhodanese-like/PpiC domain-containing protein 12, chloroplastic isoform X1 [Actinidia eriantha]
MLRACCHLPIVATTPALIPTIDLFLKTSSTLARLSSAFTPSLPKTLVPNSPTHIPYSSLKKHLGAHISPKATASFSAGSSYGDAREILVQHLLVKENDLKLLLELQKRILEGEELSILAEEYSICPSKEEGGMLGWVRKGQMVPEFEEAAFKAPVNKVVRCKTKFGWHLLEVLSERDESILQDIEPHELHGKMQEPCFVEQSQLIDVREPDEVAQASLPGFQVFPLRQFGSWGPEITTKLDPKKDTYILCHHGMRSLQVAKWLQTQGFTRVFNVSGGIHAYAVKADPSIPTY